MISRADIELGLKGVALLALVFSIWSYFDQSSERANDLSVGRSLDLVNSYRSDFLPSVQKFQLLLAPYRRAGPLSDPKSVDDPSLVRIYNGVILQSSPSEGSTNYSDWVSLILFLDSAAVCANSGLCDRSTLDQLLCGQVEYFLTDISRLLELHRKTIGPQSFGDSAATLCDVK